MPKYMLKCRYTTEGLKGLREDGGTGRREAIIASLGSLGGKLEGLYFAFGEDDAFVVVDLPDNVAAATAAMAVAASGALRLQTIPLLTPEEMDKAVKQKVTYRPPGR